MEQIIDRIILELEELKETTSFKDAVVVSSPVKFDDPGLVTTDEYPYIYVAPVSEEPVSETVGLAGYDVRNNTIQIGIVINAADYFNPAVNEMPGSREMVRASTLVRARLRRLSKQNLNGLSGVRKTVVQNTNYVPDLRDNVFVRLAVTTIVVERQYQHEE